MAKPVFAPIFPGSMSAGSCQSMVVIIEHSQETWGLTEKRQACMNVLDLLLHPSAQVAQPGAMVPSRHKPQEA